MASVRGLSARLRKLEQARMPVLSPLERAYGSLAAFEASIRSDVDAGVLDRRDMVGPSGDGGVLRALLNWHASRLWDQLRSFR